MSEPTAPQAPEAATPRTDAAERKHGAWWQRDRDAVMRGSHLDSDDPKPLDGWEFARTLESELQAVTAQYEEFTARMSDNFNVMYDALGVPESNRTILAAHVVDAANELATLRTQLAERREAMAEQGRVNMELRKSLEVAEIRAVNLEHVLTEHAKGSVTFHAECKDIAAVLHERDDLRRQLTEAQLKLKEREDRLQIDPGGGDKIDELESAMEHLRFQLTEVQATIAQLKQTAETYRVEGIKAAEKTGTDLLKRLADAEKDTARLDALDRLCESYGTWGDHEGNRWLVEGPFRDIRVACDDLIKNRAIEAARTQKP